MQKSIRIGTDELLSENLLAIFQENVTHTCAGQMHDALHASAADDATSRQALETHEESNFHPDAACDSGVRVPMPEPVHHSSGITDTESTPADHFPEDNDVFPLSLEDQ